MKKKPYARFEVRCDKNLYEKLRTLAFKKRISMAEIVRKAVKKYLTSINKGAKI